MSFFAAPTIVKRLAESPEARGADVGRMRTIIYGGAPMYREDLKRALQVFGPRLAQIYGQGESPMSIAVLSRAFHADRSQPRYEERLASVGVAQSTVEVRIADADDRTVPAGEPGEVLVRGDTVMTGYWNNPQATAEALRGGWLHTGDIGVMDDDGYITLKDRSKDVIISGGSNIYPREVEEVLLRHPGGRGSVGDRPAGSRMGRGGRRVRGLRARRRRCRRQSSTRCASTTSRATSGRRSTASSRACRRATSARRSRPNCASCWPTNGSPPSEASRSRRRWCPCRR